MVDHGLPWLTMVYHGAVFNHGGPCSPIAADDRLTVTKVTVMFRVNHGWIKMIRGLPWLTMGEQKFYKV